MASDRARNSDRDRWPAQATPLGRVPEHFRKSDGNKETEVEQREKGGCPKTRAQNSASLLRFWLFGPR